MLQMHKYEHLKPECPLMKEKNSTFKKPYKKKAFQVTWDDSDSESEEE